MTKINYGEFLPKIEPLPRGRFSVRCKMPEKLYKQYIAHIVGHEGTRKRFIQELKEFFRHNSLGFKTIRLSWGLKGVAMNIETNDVSIIPIDGIYVSHNVDNLNQANMMLLLMLIWLPSVYHGIEGFEEGEHKIEDYPALTERIFDTVRFDE